MKKLLAIGLSLIGLMSITACDKIADFINMEKSYKYDDFKAMLADRKLSFDKNKCIAIIDVDGEQSSREYFYIDNLWRYQEGSFVYNVHLDVINDAIDCEMAAAFLNKKVDQVFKFYATKNTYRIVGENKTDAEQNTMEYKFGEDGLRTTTYEKHVDLAAIKTSETKTNYTYSKVA